MNAEIVEKMFCQKDGSYRFARWGRPISPIVFGVNDESVSVYKGAIEAVVSLAGHQMAETDPELGANLMFFFMAEWSELLDVPDMDKLIPGLDELVASLTKSDANHYRLFRFDDTNAIKACFVLNRLKGDLADTPADELALAQAAQVILLWGEQAFQDRSPLARDPQSDTVILRPDVAGVIRSAYDPVMPIVADDPTHALRLAARIGAAS